mmetsp:Transcript_28818/g.61328  ORF Transcript_28818/g.61328 Transcript_28818/m.61328 type:complete len:207 (-) Transcript_28818:573-1193(-)
MAVVDCCRDFLLRALDPDYHKLMPFGWKTTGLGSCQGSDLVAPAALVDEQLGQASPGPSRAWQEQPARGRSGSLDNSLPGKLLPSSTGNTEITEHQPHHSEAVRQSGFRHEADPLRRVEWSGRIIDRDVGNVPKTIDIGTHLAHDRSRLALRQQEPHRGLLSSSCLSLTLLVSGQLLSKFELVRCQGLGRDEFRQELLQSPYCIVC